MNQLGSLLFTWSWGRAAARILAHSRCLPRDSRLKHRDEPEALRFGKFLRVGIRTRSGFQRREDLGAFGPRMRQMFGTTRTNGGVAGPVEKHVHATEAIGRAAVTARRFFGHGQHLTQRS